MWTTSVVFSTQIKVQSTNQEGKLTYQILFLQRIWSIKIQIKIQNKTANVSILSGSFSMPNLMLYYKFPY